jgi:hypothetical protein
MDSHAEVLHAGRGLWGGIPVDFALSVSRTTWHARRSSARITKVEYEFTAIHTVERHLIAQRAFASLAQAEAWAQLSVPNASALAAGGFSVAQRHPALAPWVNEELLAVCFVFDYLQLRFASEDVLDILVWPILSRGGIETRVSDSGYRDGICSFIGQTLVSADDFIDDGIVAEWPTGSLRLDPRDMQAGVVPAVIDFHGPLVEVGEPPWNQVDRA